MFENVINFLKGLAKKEQNKQTKSKDAAKERLQLVLMQDRANISADFLDLMKQEIIEVIKKYIDVDENAIDVRLTNKVNDDGTNGAPSLYANIPIISIKEDIKQGMSRQNSSKEEATKQTEVEEAQNNNEEVEEIENQNKEEDIQEQNQEDETKIEQENKQEIEKIEETEEKIENNNQTETINNNQAENRYMGNNKHSKKHKKNKHRR